MTAEANGSRGLDSIQPGTSAKPEVRRRRRLGWRGELLLAVMPTLVVLVVLAFVQALSNQRLLFATLASSAFLIYLDPQHGTNRVRTLVISQLLAALYGFATYGLISNAYVSGGSRWSRRSSR